MLQSDANLERHTTCYICNYEDIDTVTSFQVHVMRIVHLKLVNKSVLEFEQVNCAWGLGEDGETCSSVADMLSKTGQFTITIAIPGYNIIILLIESLSV